ncbi:MAG: hypothetical protein IKO42_05885 [Opitutales bacterium]|nr:hypothetical protein [Opitutales bacterium]
MKFESQQKFKAGGGAEVSKTRFDELLSLYLDNRATKEELELLGRLVSLNPKAAAEFAKARRVHIATCKMFGKERVVLPRLPVYTIKMRSRKRAAAEWSVVAILMLTCIFTFRLAQKAMYPETEAFGSEVFEELPDFDPVYEFFFENHMIAEGESCSFFRIIRREDADDIKL